MFFLVCSSNSLLAVALDNDGLVDASPAERNHRALIPSFLKTDTNTKLTAFDHKLPLQQGRHLVLLKK